LIIYKRISGWNTTGLLWFNGTIFIGTSHTCDKGVIGPLMNINEGRQEKTYAYS